VRVQDIRPVAYFLPSHHDGSFLGVSPWLQQSCTAWFCFPRNRSLKPCIGWITASCGRPPGLRSAPAEKLHPIAATLQVSRLIMGRASPSSRFTLQRPVLRIPPFPPMFRKQPIEGTSRQRIVVSSSSRWGRGSTLLSWHFVCRLSQTLTSGWAHGMSSPLRETHAPRGSM
jgi:hypothetical protein